MAHLPDTAHETARRGDRPSAFRRYSDAERARMRGILEDMGTRGAQQTAVDAAARSAPPGPRRRPLVAGLAIATCAGGALLWFGPLPRGVIAGAGTRLGALMPSEQPGAAPPGPQPSANAEPGSGAAPEARNGGEQTVSPPAPVAPGPALEASGKVVAKREATLSSDVTGRLAELLVREGDTVKAGDLVARLDGEAARAQVAIARANVAAAEEERAVVAAELAAMEDDLKRTRTLADRGVATKQALSELKGRHRVIEARLASRERQIAVQRRQLDAMRNDIDNTRIRAPFGGVVTEITANLGEIVSPVSSGGYTQSGIATIVDPHSIVGEVNVNEQFLSKIETGQAVEMSVPAWPDRTFDGEVALVTPTVDESTAAVKVTVAFAPVPERIYPGMRLDVAFLSETDEPEG